MEMQDFSMAASPEYMTLLSLALLLFFSGVSASTFRVTNSCNFTVWPAILRNSGKQLGTAGFVLKPGESTSIPVPASFNGRIWGRTGCSQSQGNFSCLTGDCGSSTLECHRGAAPPTTLAEFGLNISNAKDFYDVTIVDGYNLPILVAPQNGLSNNCSVSEGCSCSSTGCVEDVNRACPAELRVTNKDNKETVACKSSCDAFRDPEHCCTGNYSSPATCQPTAFSNFFKRLCPKSYSYPFDDAISLYTCEGATQYDVTFCPSNGANLVPVSTASSPPPKNTNETEASNNIMKKRKKNKMMLKKYVAIIVPVFFVFFIGVVTLVYYLRNKRESLSDDGLVGALKNLPGMPREFQYGDLKKATKDFDEENKLGKGGFGVVYKGLFEKDNLQVAVKMFCRDQMKGRDDFLSELTIINRLRHKNLVPLLGWCYQTGRLLLIYEYMPNGSLDKHLFSNKDGDTVANLEWKLRYNILAGVASALNYLHNDFYQRVVHRDLKASNIMLDSNYSARLGDFGLARALDNGKTSYAEAEGVPGTKGYIAPECFLTGKASCDSDIFGFGAVILEVVCGKRPWTKLAGFNFLVDWVWWLHREGRILDAVDNRLGSNYVAEEAESLLLLGLACSHPTASERPKADLICQMMGGLIEVPHVPPIKPAFVWQSDTDNILHIQTISSDAPASMTPCTMPR